VDAARLVLNGYDSAFNVAGGLHHAHPDHAAGFCTFNDCALGIHELLRGGCERVAYIDIDAHHGDGVQACFYDDPRVLTVSLHESGKSLYPGTGFPSEIGAPGAEGSSVNLPYYRYTSDDVWHEAFDAVIPDVLARFNADAYLFQFGADAHYGDPLAHLMLTSRGWMQAVEKLFQLASGKPIIITGGGGYNIRTVARLWTMVMAHAAGVTLPDEVPAAYAAEYGIPNLHDTERMPPVTEELRVEGRNLRPCPRQRAT
jgi:acetoin utilization protein AcuC